VPIDDEDLKRMIQSRPIPDKLLEDLRLTLRIDEDDVPPAGVPSAAALHRGSLSPAEKRVLLMASHGMQAKMIAEVFGISKQTVLSQLKSARYALRAKNTAHAIALALRMGLIE
jgi:DNA-binding CsgD family transcriptional regulator